MKLSFTTLATPELNGVEAVKLAAEIGYDGVDLRVSDNRGEVTLGSGAREINEIREALESEGITLSSLLCYNRIAGLGREAVNAAVDAMKRHIELAERLGAVSIRVPAGKREDGADFGACLEAMAEVLIKSADEGSGDIDLLLQNHFGEFNSIECAKVVKAVNKPNVKLFFSTEHCLIMGENYDEVLKEIDGTVGHVFLSDIVLKENGYEDVLPGTGEVPLNKIFTAIGGRAFDGWISFKWERMWHPELAAYETALPYFLKYIKGLL